ncbi:MAG: phage terminase large subunit [Clostridia bacterium]|jgi:phage terminase large subunit|nr:phage terminase large subunit [Clostridia bacterium]
MQSLKAEIQTPKVYQPVFEKKSGYVVIKSGRDAGKTKVAAQKAVLTLMSTQNRDVIVCRDSYSDLETSDYAEIIDMASELGLEASFTYGKAPLRIRKRDGSGIAYFVGIGGADFDRTKSLKTKHPVSLIVLDELQQTKNRESLEQALASFRRLLDPDNWLILFLFNPPAQKSHWINVWASLKQDDADYTIIHSSYLDVLPFLNDVDLKEILKDKLFNRQHYEWFYMGEASGGYGSVYPMFDIQKHLIPEQLISVDKKYKFLKQRIVGMVIGVDSAVTNDSTVLVPIAILESGQTMVLQMFYHDPIQSGSYASAQLVEKFVSVWFSQLRKQHNLDDPQARVPIIFSVDSAAPEMVKALRYFFSNRAEVYAFKKPTIMQMVDIVQSVIAKNMSFIIDFKGYYDYAKNRFINTKFGEHPLAKQLDMLIWNEKQTGYDPIIPNDASDAYTYGICFWFKNPENLHWLEVVKYNRSEYYELA